MSTSSRHAPPRPRSIDAILDHARKGLQRLTPLQTLQARERGALLVDIRPRDLRASEGEIPGSLLIERNVLEWRLDPASPHRIGELTSYDHEIVVICQEGYTSSLAAAALQELGLLRATDLVGGVAAWRREGYPLRAGGGPARP